MNDLLSAIGEMDEREVAFALVAIKARCGQLGLLRTMHAIEPATQVIGYELAEHIESRKKTAEIDTAKRAAIRGRPRP